MQNGISQMSEKVNELRRFFGGLLQPPPRTDLARWSEENIQLPEGQSARPGPLKHWPYMRDIINCIGDRYPERVTLMKSIRLGFTKGIMCGVAAAAANDPSPIIILEPTDEDARRTAVEEVEPIFESSPKIKHLIRKGRNDGRNTILRKSLLGGGSVKILSAHAPRKLRSHDAKYLFIDEADAMEITTEGDPVELAIGRTFAQAQRKIVMGSTPTEEGISVIERNYEESDQRIFEVPCPRCGVFNEIQWTQIRWPQDETGYRPDQAYYECPHCSAEIQERDKPTMVYQGRWRATRPDIQNHAGFRISALVSLLPNAAWSKLAAMFLKAKRGGPAEMQPFYNLYLGRTWRMTIKRVDADILRERVEPFGLDNIPVEVLMLTVGADVQDDRIEAVVLGWTLEDHGNVPFVLAHLQFDGNTLEGPVWSKFDAWLKSKWRHPNGWRIGVDACAVDSGGREGRTQVVYDWTYPRLGRNIYAIKGRPNPNKVWVRAQKVKGDMRLHLVAVDVVKTEVLDGLANEPFDEHGNRNRAGMRYSENLPDEWFDQVTNEVRRIKYEHNRPKIVFEVKREGLRVEGLDATVYGWAVRQAPAIRAVNLRARSEIRIVEESPEPVKKRKTAADFSAVFNG